MYIHIYIYTNRSLTKYKLTVKSLKLNKIRKKYVLCYRELKNKTCLEMCVYFLCLLTKTKYLK